MALIIELLCANIIGILLVVMVYINSEYSMFNIDEPDGAESVQKINNVMRIIIYVSFFFLVLIWIFT